MTERTEIFERLKKLILDQMEGLSDVTAEKVVESAAFIDDLGFDSLDNVEFIMSAEEEFDLEISDDEAEHITTVKDAVDLIQRLQAPAVA